MPDSEMIEDGNGNLVDRRNTDKVILKEIFSINTTLKDMNGKIQEALSMKAIVEAHEKQINGDKENLGSGGIVHTLTTIVAKATMVASLVAVISSGIWTLIIALVIERFGKG